MALRALLPQSPDRHPQPLPTSPGLRVHSKRWQICCKAGYPRRRNSENNGKGTERHFLCVRPGLCFLSSAACSFILIPLPEVTRTAFLPTSQTSKQRLQNRNSLLTVQSWEGPSVQAHAGTRGNLRPGNPGHGASRKDPQLPRTLVGTEALTYVLLFMANHSAGTVLWQMVKTPAKKERERERRDY